VRIVQRNADVYRMLYALSPWPKRRILPSRAHNWPQSFASPRMTTGHRESSRWPVVIALS